MTCTIYIDESGDSGFTKIRKVDQGGSSPYLTMSAVVFQPAGQIAGRQLLDRLQHDFRKTKRWRHVTDLNHSQRLHFCKEAAKLHARFFGVISYKPTLDDYAQEIDWDPHMFYNKCAKYLLELIGKYLLRVDNRLLEPQIIFEERNHDYDRMIRFITKVKENPLYPQSNFLSAINPFAITKKTKAEEDLLRFADLVAHSLYSCVNKTPENFGIVETRYLRELSPRFAADKSGKVIGTGIKPIHDLNHLNLDPDVVKTISGLRAMPP